MLFVEVPPYRDQTISHPAKVNFYVINGKKKRSQPQHFIYTPVIGTYILISLLKYRRRAVFRRRLKGQKFPPGGQQLTHKCLLQACHHGFLWDKYKAGEVRLCHSKLYQHKRYA